MQRKESRGFGLTRKTGYASCVNTEKANCIKKMNNFLAILDLHPPDRQCICVCVCVQMLRDAASFTKEGTDSRYHNQVNS